MSESNAVIGINFGTSSTSIGYVNKEGRADCLANQEGDRQIASVLAFHGEEEVVGSQAKSEIARHPKTTVANFRATLGKTFAESEDLPGSAAPVVDKAGTPGYEITFGEETKVFSTQDISAKFLRHIRESAEGFFGNKIDGAVMAVPSYFTDKQREDFKQAATDAGIKVLQLVQEPTAAALAYGLGQKDDQDKTVVVCDLGGHSFDVTVMTVRSGIYSVLATAHDTKLGGVSFDDLLIKHFSAEFKKKTKVDLANNAKALSKLRGAVEMTKKMLSSASSAPCFVESLAEGLDFHGTINRMRFEILSNSVFAKLQEVVRQVLVKADLDASEIDEVVLAGGAARIPKFAVKLREVFTADTHIHNDLEADEVVARGCAIQASLIAGFDPEDIEAAIHPVVTLAPSTQKAIGVLNASGAFVPIIPKGTALPARRSFTFTPAGEQSHVYVALHEGDHVIEKKEIPVEPIPVEEGEEPYEEEPEIVTTVFTKPAALLIEAVLPVSSKSTKVEVQVTVNVDGKLTLVLRDTANVVKAEVAGKQ
ncbi:heat shock protein 70 family [Halteromyces radiatus]|uniref:heat shock protein 70 family n=1 Tax=Halteromyces radiatus TaxID=101107 RepID=UPI002221085A|nr:heat shock protein 70 family [Halteromyces radiatus]KAI8078893.1 heat shock protein 70 family [Halteromyces radiatus]